MIIINFKNYKHGNEALKLAKKIQKHLPNAIIAPSTPDISLISKNTKLKIISQTLDSPDSDNTTGFLTPEAVKKSGAKGSLLNHSEHPIPIKTIRQTVRLARAHNLKIVLCVQTLKKVKKLLKKLQSKPWAIAFEDKKLIGTKKSITKYRKRKVKKFAKLLKDTDIIPLCGAGIHSAKDVKAAKEFGCKGVLIASAVAKVKNPDKFLKAISKV